MWFYLICFVLIIVLLLLLSFVWPPDSPWSPWWRTNKKIAEIVGSLAKISDRDAVYELGSGDGEFAVYISKRFGAHVTGIEIDPLRYYISRIRAFFSGTGENLQFVRSDFKKVDISSATVLYMYLVPRVLKRIFPKLKKELKPGTRVVTYIYTMELPLVAKDTKEKVYVYKI